MTVTEEVNFVPPEFDVPRRLIVGDLTLVPLGPEHNEPDYRAWTSSVEHIKRTPGFERYPWPVPMTLEDNLADLREHADDFQRRKGFTYTVTENGDIVGCVYIYPIKARPGWATVRSWVRHDRAELDDVLYYAVREWLASWPFEDVEYAAR